jgi:AbrB family looped-hinge helix DNA binding protein
MAIATMTTKGQITIPKEIRDALRLKPGDRVAFVLLEDGTAKLRPMNVKLEDLIGIIKYHGPPVTIEQMNEAIRNHAVRKFRRGRP